MERYLRCRRCGRKVSKAECPVCGMLIELHSNDQFKECHDAASGFQRA